MPAHIDVARDRNLIYDVGMHRGEDSEFYLRKDFRVVAFEAHPDLIAHCKQRLREFLDSGQLTIVEGAIVDPDLIRNGQETVSFYKNDQSSVWGTIRTEWAERNARQGLSSSVIEVKAIDFAEAIRTHGMPHYMKVDIEGCDLICLQALAGFEERPDYISIESDKTNIQCLEEEVKLLIKLGYTSFQAVEQSQIPAIQHPPNPAREGKYVHHRFERAASGLFGAELGGKWKSKRELLRQYRFVYLGYFLLGDNGIMGAWKFPGARLARSAMRRFVRLFTHAPVPGWYDTHARLG